MDFSELSKIHSIPEKPVFSSCDLCSLFKLTPSTLSRIRAKGWLQSLPGVARVTVPRAELFRYVAAASPSEFTKSIQHNKQ